MNRAEIEALLPHREPFLLVDEVIEVEPGVRCVAVKHVRADEDWARGHFPGNPVFPGVLLTEALAQTAALVFLSTSTEHAGKSVYLVGLDKVRFRRMIRPGESITLTATLTDARHGMWRFDVAAAVGDERAFSGQLLATVDR